MRAKPGPAAKLLPSAHAIEREFRVMSALAGTGVPVPRMHLLCEDEAVIGRAFYVMECVEGRVLWDQSLPGMSAAERARDLRRDEPRDRRAAQRRRAGRRAWPTTASRATTSSARSAAGASSTWPRSPRPIEAMDRADRLAAGEHPGQRARRRQVSIVHGDYRLDNLMFHPTEPRILAVLDWELSTLGHPLADFSYHCMRWHIPPGDVPRHRRAGPGGARHPRRDATTCARYCERTGRGARRVDAVMADWNFYLAYNLFRLAGDPAGHRQARASTAPPRARRPRQAGAPAHAPLADMGWQFAQIEPDHP